MDVSVLFGETLAVQTRSECHSHQFVCDAWVFAHAEQK